MDKIDTGLDAFQHDEIANEIKLVHGPGVLIH